MVENIFRQKQWKIFSTKIAGNYFPVEKVFHRADEFSLRGENWFGEMLLRRLVVNSDLETIFWKTGLKSDRLLREFLKLFYYMHFSIGFFSGCRGKS